MKKFIFILLITSTFNSYAQLSNYYNVDSNVNVSGSIYTQSNVNVNKTIETIDYGALAQANALRERNRIEKIKYADKRKREIAYEIANNPLKAFDYGQLYKTEWRNKEAIYYGKSGWAHLSDYIIKPHILFQPSGGNGYINISNDNIITEIKVLGVIQRIKGHILEEHELDLSVEEILKKDKLKVQEYVKLSAEENPIQGFLHKKDLNRSKVWYNDGFVGTYVIEDDYENRIIDIYLSPHKKFKFLNMVIVEYKGDKDFVDFEMLEGRKYYFKQLIDRVVMTGYTKWL